jgi:DNA-binding FadR family transcriptional regulator
LANDSSVTSRYLAPLSAVTSARTGNVFEDTIECLLRIIRLGIVPPGERFPSERELAGQLGVSRATLRDAISELQSAGWVDVRRGRGGGTFVSGCEADTPRRHQLDDSAATGLQAAEVEDTLKWRRVIELGIVEIAAEQSLSAAQRYELSGCLQESLEATSDNYRRLDSRLHLALAKATGAPSLIRSMAESRTRINQLLDKIPVLDKNLTHSNEQHRAIVAAVFSGDPAAARAAMAEHLDGTAALLRGFLV